MKVEVLEVELKRLPGGVMRLAHTPIYDTVTISIVSPCIGVLTFELPEQISPRIEKWFHDVADPKSHGE